MLPNEKVIAHQGQTEAFIEVSGQTGGIAHQTRYSLNTNTPDQLFIETRLTRIAEGERLFLFGALTLHPLRSLSPFSFSSHQEQFSQGFHYPHVQTDNPLAMLKVMFPTDIHILVGPEHLSSPISYGIQSVSAEHIDINGVHHRLREFSITDAEFSLMGNFVRPLWFDTDQQPGLLQFMQTPFMDLDTGESLVIKKKILVSPHIDVKKMAHQLSPAADIDFLLSGNEEKDSAQKQPAVIQLPHGQIMQLVFKGIQGTADPLFYPDQLDFRVGEKKYTPHISSNRLSFAGINSDPKQVEIAPGQYRVYAHRGPEYSVSSQILNITEGEKFSLSIDTPQHILETRGWLAADLHVHSEYSFDSTLPAKQRIREFVAQGGEVLVSTEHKRTVDFAPLIGEMSLKQEIASVVGVELSGMAHTSSIPRTIGHSNVFPVSYDAKQFMGSTLPHENRRLGHIIHDYKQQNPHNIFQLNHPRGDFALDADINFLNHLSIGQRYDPSRPLGDPQNHSLLQQLPGSTYRDIDFDAIELLNGEDFSQYETVRADWFSFLKQGYKKTATANSDSHRSDQLVAMPRNYIMVKDDRISHFKETDFISAIHAGKVSGSTGPLLQIELENKQTGETFTGKNGHLLVTVDSVGWIPVNELLVYINGELFDRRSIAGSGQYSVPLKFTEDGFVTVEVKGVPGQIYRDIYPGLFPFAFSNPIYVRIND
jgi:hypothetical protein